MFKSPPLSPVSAVSPVQYGAPYRVTDRKWDGRPGAAATRRQRMRGMRMSVLEAAEYDRRCRVQCSSPVLAPRGSQVASNGTAPWELHKVDLKRWDKQWEEQLRATSCQGKLFDLFVSHVQEMLKCDRHALSAVFKRTLTQCYTAIMNANFAKKAVVKSVIGAVETLVPMFLNFYSNAGSSSDGFSTGAQMSEKLWCDCLFEFLFRTLHPLLYRWYARQCGAEDLAFASKLHDLSSRVHSLGCIGGDFNPRLESVDYSEPVRVLAQITKKNSPLALSQVFVDVLYAIYATVIKAWGEDVPPEKLAMAADDLLPVLDFVVIKAGVENLPSICRYLEDLLSDEEMEGDRGYMLTSISACVQDILSRDANLFVAPAKALPSPMHRRNSSDPTLVVMGGAASPPSRSSSAMPISNSPFSDGLSVSQTSPTPLEFTGPSSALHHSSPWLRTVPSSPRRSQTNRLSLGLRPQSTASPSGMSPLVLPLSDGQLSPPNFALNKPLSP